MLIRNLAGLFTGSGFGKKGGRRPTLEDSSFIEGPVDIACDSSGGKIITVGRVMGDIDREVFDGTGLYATAGFVDSHTHALFAGDRAHEFFLRWGGANYVDIAKAGGGILNSVRALDDISDTAALGCLRANLEKSLRSGCTTVEVKSGYGLSPAAELRQLRLMKSLRGARDLPSLALTFLGLHALPKGANESAFVDSMIALLPQIRSEGLADFADAFPEEGFFSLKESLRFVEAAKKAGLGAKIHADEITDIKASETFTRMGALSVDHLQKINAAAMKALAEAPTVATLLPATSFYLGLPYAPARKLIEAGARVALATDFNPGTAPSHDFAFTNLLAASQMRMSAAEILCAATYNGAAALGREKSVGLLAPGFSADLLLWKTQSRKAPDLLEEIFSSSLKPSAVFLQARQA